jgi:hypothetical protein
MLNESVILRRRNEAKYHVQVRLTNVPNDIHPQFIGSLRLRGRVIEMFRANDTQLQIGDFIEFDINVVAEKAQLWQGTSLLEYSGLLHSNYIEMFVDFISKQEFGIIQGAVSTDNVILSDFPTPQPLLSESSDDEITTIPVKKNNVSPPLFKVQLKETEELPPPPGLLSDWKKDTQ